MCPYIYMYAADCLVLKWNVHVHYNIIAELNYKSCYCTQHREIAKNCMTGKPDGSFLIRDATTPREYTLFVQNKGSIKYVRILSSRGKYGLADPKIFTTEPVLGSFPSVIALVDYFSTNSLAKLNHSLDVTLSYPLSKFRLVSTIM